MSNITSSSPFEFIVSGSGEDYMDLNNTLLEVKACIKTTNDSPVDAALQLYQKQYIAQYLQSN